MRTIEDHFADRLFLSVKGIADTGALTDVDPLEAEVKRAMIAQAGRSTVLLDRSKLEVRGLSVIARSADVSDLLAYGLDAREAAQLRASGATVRVLADEAASARRFAGRSGAQPPTS